jgi:hypothetical protein
MGNRVTDSNRLSSKHPDLMASWHPTLNGDLLPKNVSQGSGKKAFWICARDRSHVWASTIASRVKGAGCPVCAGRLATPQQNLAVEFPDVAAQWHPTMNNAETPETVPSGSQKKFHWKCSKGADHVWQTAVQKRTRERQGCPFCLNQRLSVTNCLSALRPDLAAEWHPTANPDLTPETVIATAGTVRVWWQCPKGKDHVWCAAPATRRKLGCTCPFCNQHKPSDTNRLRIRYPEIAAQWHPTRNPVPVDDIIAGTGRTAWWVCQAGHEWKATPSTRTRLLTGCAKCKGLRATKTHNLAALYPDFAAQWHPTLNQPTTPEQVGPLSSTKVWWKCSKGPDHEWRSAPGWRVSDNLGCPFCSNRKVSVTNRLTGAALFTKTIGGRRA